MNYEFNKDELLTQLKDLRFYSQFICYNSFNKNGKKMRKKLNKIISDVKKDKYDDILD